MRLLVSMDESADVLAGSAATASRRLFPDVLLLRRGQGHGHAGQVVLVADHGSSLGITARICQFLGSARSWQVLSSSLPSARDLDADEPGSSRRQRAGDRTEAVEPDA